MNTWTFLSNHAHVLVCVFRNPEIRAREVAELVGITERAVQRIVADLVEAGCLQRDRRGRRNAYTVCGEAHLRHPLEAGCTIAEFLHLLKSAELKSAEGQSAGSVGEPLSPLGVDTDENPGKS